jgi:homoserine O-acetyltransferase
MLPRMLLALLIALAPPAEGNLTLKDFHFASGEVLPELRIHYRTWGDPSHPAVLVLHGTTGSGAQFVGDDFAGVLFGKGQLLDAEKHFIVLPDGIGHGKSSKPSDGLHARFPHYTYDDMVAAQHELLAKLGVKHLRLVIGTSMGGMHTWMWGEKYPDAMDALMPLASAPVQIAGRNRVMRSMVMDSIRGDPAWAKGEYREQPLVGLRGAMDVILLMGSAPLRWHDQYPDRDGADAFYRDWMKKRLPGYDANDVLYAFDASRDYDPSPRLASIRVPLVAVNSSDDAINPPELGILEREIKKVPQGEYVLIPASKATRGHGTHTFPVFWKQHLARLLEKSGGLTDSSGERQAAHPAVRPQGRNP